MTDDKPPQAPVRPSVDVETLEAAVRSHVLPAAILNDIPQTRSPVKPLDNDIGDRLVAAGQASGQIAPHADPPVVPIATAMSADELDKAAARMLLRQLEQETK